MRHPVEQTLYGPCVLSAGIKLFSALAMLNRCRFPEYDGLQIVLVDRAPMVVRDNKTIRSYNYAVVMWPVVINPNHSVSE